MTIEDLLNKMLEPCYLKGKSWALGVYEPYVRNFKLFREFLEHQLDPRGDAFFPIEYRALHRVVFGSFEEIPLLLNSEVPGVADIATQRLFHHV